MVITAGFSDSGVPRYDAQGKVLPANIGFMRGRHRITQKKEEALRELRGNALALATGSSAASESGKFDLATGANLGSPTKFRQPPFNSRSNGEITYREIRGEVCAIRNDRPRGAIQAMRRAIRTHGRLRN